MGMQLGLAYDKLVTEKITPDAPIIAFRKKGTCKTKPEDIQRAIDIGYLVEKLVKYMPEKFERPATLISPSEDYKYLNDVCGKIRREIGLTSTDTISFEKLIGKINKLHAVLIPVLWGEKQNHENAIHIYLPSSMTTWIYINLDTNIHDFKFWMAHELGHVYSSPTLSGDSAEDFADAFAQTLLFPEELAKETYMKLKNVKKDSEKIEIALKAAGKYIISPNTVIEAVHAYAKANNLANIDFGKKYYGAITNFNKKHPLTSEDIFKTKQPSARVYIDKSEETFKTPFFKKLKEYLNYSKQSVSFIQSILQLPIMDAKALIKEL
jgi:Zn-dependent peptidase ImmA (M78 family)